MAEDLTPTNGPGGALVETSAPPASPPGYELIDEIGHGGMGVVYRARDLALDRYVAVKLLSDRYPAHSPAAQRFLSEARITGQLQHPGIPAVHQVGTLADGRPFLAMKLIKGSTLEANFEPRTDPAAERGRLLAIFEAVCQAVGYAHAHHVIHRDLKPANVMVGAFGEVQVMDWGLAKVLGEERSATTEALATEETRAWTEVRPTPEVGSYTQAGSLVGTPAFIPPEQALGEIGKIDERADVFGLGALLAMILTGKPPYVGESFESVRVQAARGKLEDCFARLDASGAEPELVALCKRCLAFEPADRPPDAGAVAQAVADLRAAADERARRAELERVRVEGEQATAKARAAERRKRRQLVIGAAAVLALAALGGLMSVLTVQRQANADLADKNAELAAEQAKVEARNKDLAAEQAKVQARFELAQKAIALFHTGVSEDALLKNAEFKELRTKLLREAAGFYSDLEKLLAGQTDAKSRKALAAAYFQLAQLTDKIGDKKEALALHRKALALRRELAAAEGADVETRLDVAHSLQHVGWLLIWMGEPVEALAALEEDRDLAERLEAEHPTDAVRSVLAHSHNLIGAVLDDMGKLQEALGSYRKALAIRRKLADANPAVTELQRVLSVTYYNIARLQTAMGKPAEALTEYAKALPIAQKLADANPAASDFRYLLGTIHNNIGINLVRTGKPEEAMAAYREALAIIQKLVVANPAVADFQYVLSLSHNRIGYLLSRTGKPQEAMASHQEALAICRKLSDANPMVPSYQDNLATAQISLGRLLAREKRFGEAFTALDAGLAIYKKLTGPNPNGRLEAKELGYSHAYRGWASLRSGQPSQAAADLRRAVELWSKNKVPDNGDLFEQSRALALLAGLEGEAKSGVTKVEAAVFAAQAVAALRDAFNAGWPWPDELKEPDFDALRGRDDFKKLLAEVEAKSGPRTKPKD